MASELAITVPSGAGIAKARQVMPLDVPMQDGHQTTGIGATYPNPTGAEGPTRGGQVMLIALTPTGLDLATATGERAKCPACGQPVLSKVGEIVVPHWAHLSANCGHYAPMTEWHYQVQRRAVKNHGYRFEQTITEGGRVHRADLVAPNGLVIELQTDPLDPDEARKREKFYNARKMGMVWLFRGERQWQHQHRIRELNNRAYWHDSDGYRVQMGAVSRCHYSARHFSGIPEHNQSEWDWYEHWPDHLRGDDDRVDYVDFVDIDEFLRWAANWSPSHLLAGGSWQHGVWSR